MIQSGIHQTVTYTYTGFSLFINWLLNPSTNIAGSWYNFISYSNGSGFQPQHLPTLLCYVALSLLICQMEQESNSVTFPISDLQTLLEGFSWFRYSQQYTLLSNTKSIDRDLDLTAKSLHLSIQYNIKRYNRDIL